VKVEPIEQKKLPFGVSDLPKEAKPAKIEEEKV
jgi:hypothetical protein